VAAARGQRPAWQRGRLKYDFCILCCSVEY
jgi:hypothetical protein